MIIKNIIRFEFLEAVSLGEVDRYKNILQNNGVYFIIYSTKKPSNKNFDIVGKSIVYIGKSITDSIYSRIKKHISSIKNELYSSGKPKTAPGKRFVSYRQSIGHNISNHWVIPCLVTDAKGYEISYMEEYFLFIFHKKNKGMPLANTFNHSNKI